MAARMTSASTSQRDGTMISFFVFLFVILGPAASTLAFSIVPPPPAPSSSYRLLSSTIPTAVAAGGSLSQVPTPTQLQAEVSSSSSSSTKTTLNEETTWNLRMVLQNLPTRQGKAVDQIILALRVKFIEEEGYEPPQGIVQQCIDDDQKNKDVAVIKSSRWQLSEDPNERKDSLWIWGLFKEPLYPYLLLRMDFEEIPLPGSGVSSDNDDDANDENSKKDVIAPFSLFAQIDHKRENGQVLLSSGADLTIKQKETIKADPFGAATVDVFEDIPVGKLQIQAIAAK